MLALISCKQAQTLINIGIIGAGHMGSAMVAGWLRANFGTIHVLAKAKGELPVKYYLLSAQDDFIANVDVIFVAVRPSSWPSIKTWLKTEKLKVSLMAGINLDELSSNSNNWARIMPNLPVAHGLGAIALHTRKASHGNILCPILAPLGEIISISNEKLLYGFTAIAGSGPAWLWHYTNEWQLAAIAQGFSAEEAHKIVMTTIKGTIAMTGDANLETVASKGGTTEAGLKKLNAGGSLSEAIVAAATRAKELAQP